MKYMLLGLPVVLGASLGFSADEARIRNLENRVTSIECSQNSCCMVNPPARPYPADCWGFYVSIDPLIWQAHMNGLPVAIETKDGTSLFNGNRNKVKKLDFDWDWGFRLGLGFNLSHDGWDLLLEWTRWRTDARRNFSAGANEVIYPVQGHPARTFSQFGGRLESDWDLDYDLLDFVLGREFFVSHCLTMRPFGGLRTAWIEQKWDVELSEIPPNVQNPISPNTRHDVEKRDRFWGIGIRGGVDMQWGVGWDFSLFSNFAGNLLYAYHSVKQDEFASEDDGPKSALFRIENFYHVGTSIFDAQIGVRYDWRSCDDCYHLGLDLGWEHHFHHGQNQFMLFVDEAMDGKFVANQGDLGVQGYFFKIRFDF